MENTFVVARNSDSDSKLGYVIRFSVGDELICLKTSGEWPRVSRLYCHPVEEWSNDFEILSTCEIESAVKRGIAVDLILKRHRENRSQIIFTSLKGGRKAIFWQTPRTAKTSKAGIRIPKKRSSKFDQLEIIVDTREQYAYKFNGKQVSLVKRALRVGDYAVEYNDRVIAVVERKSSENFLTSLISGDLTFAMAALSEVPNSAVAVEGKYSQLLKSRFAQPSFLIESVAALEVRYPNVRIIFLESRSISEEWTYRFLGSALRLEIGDEETSEYASS